MTVGADRRTVLAGLGALALGACSREAEGQGEAVAGLRTPAAPETLSLEGLERENGGRIGLAVLDLNAMRQLHWRADERFTYCSTFKLFLAAATLERAMRGEERMDRAVPIAAADMIPHAPVTQPAVGSSLTIEQLCKATVEVSDNPAANILIREMGGLEAWRAWYPSIGDTTTRVDRLEPELNRVGDELDTTTPAQSVRNLTTLFAGRTLDEERLALLERWLVDSPTGAARIKAGVPEGWIVAHKTGTGGSGPVNDIGLIRPPSGAPIFIALYYEATASSAPDRREAVLAETTRLALKALGHG